jgi:hypothetical protein
MDLETCVDEVADAADAFLQPADGPPAARIDIRDYVLSHHPEMSKAECSQVVSGVIAILEREDFFGQRTRREIWPEGREVDVDGL